MRVWTGFVWFRMGTSGGLSLLAECLSLHDELCTVRSIKYSYHK